MERQGHEKTGYFQTVPHMVWYKGFSYVCSICACLVLSSSSCLGWATACDCDTPWIFLLPLLKGFVSYRFFLNNQFQSQISVSYCTRYTKQSMAICVYSRNSMARTSLGPWKFVRDMGSSSH